MMLTCTQDCWLHGGTLPMLLLLLLLGVDIARTHGIS
jgi:hypothetical protein